MNLKLELSLSYSGDIDLPELRSQLAAWLRSEYPGIQVKFGDPRTEETQISYSEWRREVVSVLDARNRMGPESCMLLLEEDGSPATAYHHGISPENYADQAIKSRSEIILERRSVPPRLLK